MQKTTLRKANIKDMDEIVDILKESNYVFNEISINKFSVEEIKSFVKANIDFFTLYIINNKVQGYAIAYSLKNPINNSIFKVNPSIFKRLMGLFVTTSATETPNDFQIEIIHFNKEIEGNNNIFVKFLELERIKNQCNRIVY